MLTNRDIEMLAYVKSQGKIVKFGNDIHPYDIPELNELTKLNLLTCTDHTMPAPEGDHPDNGKCYALTRRGKQVLSDCQESNVKACRNDLIIKITLAFTIISTVIAALSLII